MFSGEANEDSEHSAGYPSVDRVWPLIPITCQFGEESPAASQYD
jgi:hypothetical protein